MDAPFWGGVAFTLGHFRHRKAVVILPSTISCKAHGYRVPCLMYLFPVYEILAEQQVLACACNCNLYIVTLTRTLLK